MIAIECYNNLASDMSSGGCRILKRRFHGLVDPRCRGVGAQPPAAEDVLIFINTLSIEIYHKLHINSDIVVHVYNHY